MADTDQTGTGASKPAPMGRQQTAMLILLALASFVVILNAAALPIPLPSIMEDLSAKVDEIAWVLGAFIVVFAILLLPCARLGDVYGRRRLFLLGISLVTVASLACALSPSVGFLIGAQAVLGAGAAMVEPATFGIITATVPAAWQRRAFGMQTAGFFAGGGLGPLLSGAITTGMSWQFLFWLDALLGVLIVVGAALVLPESRTKNPVHQWDLRGFALGAVGLVALMFAVIEGTRLGWGSPLIVGASALSGAALTAFVVAEARASRPLVDLRLFRNRAFAVGNVVRASTEFASLGIFFALSHFLQVQLGYSALAAGALLMAVIAATVCTAPITEALTGRIDLRWLMLPGFILAAAGTFWAAHVSPGSDWLFFLAPLVLFGAGIGGLESPADTAIRANTPAEKSETGWRVSYVTYLLGIGLGVAVVSAVWQTRLAATVPAASAWRGIPGEIDDPSAYADAINTALLACVAVAVLGALLTLLLPSRTAEPSTR